MLDDDAGSMDGRRVRGRHKEMTKLSDLRSLGPREVRSWLHGLYSFYRYDVYVIDRLE